MQTSPHILVIPARYKWDLNNVANNGRKTPELIMRTMTMSLNGFQTNWLPVHITILNHPVQIGKYAFQSPSLIKDC